MKKKRNEKEKKKKRKKNQNRISCQDQGVDCLSRRVCLEFKRNVVNLHFVCI